MKLKLHVYIVILFMTLAGCGPSEDEMAATVSAKVEATVSAIPTQTPYPTYTPQPTSTPLPTLAPVTADLATLYCDFAFCIRRPANSVTVPGYATDFVLEVVDDLNDEEAGVQTWLRPEQSALFLGWRESQRDPAAMVGDFLDDPGRRSLSGVTEEEMGGNAVAYTTYEEPGDNLPYGLFAAWRCGDRVFTWWIQLEAGESADQLPDRLRESVSDFVCAP